jgi:putative RNA 2'-phosphotransferase
LDGATVEAMKRSVKEIVKISKFLSLVLRHKPEIIGLKPDRGGWVAVDDLLEALAAAGRPLTREALEQVVLENDKQRFTMSAAGRRIKANYGHSIPVDLDIGASVPPEVLFHGTATRFLGSIMAHGIKPSGRRYVHLSVDEATAAQVGRRHGKAVILRIGARRTGRQVSFKLKQPDPPVE